jgi:hypothetical protein
MRRFFINLLLSDNQMVVSKKVLSFDQNNHLRLAQSFNEVYSKLVMHRYYCNKNGINFQDIENAEVPETKPSFIK